MNPDMNPDEAAASLALATNLQKQLLMQGRSTEKTGSSKPVSENMPPEVQESPPNEPQEANEQEEPKDTSESDSTAQMAEMHEKMTSEFEGLKTEVKELVKESIKSEMSGLTKVIKDALKE